MATKLNEENIISIVQVRHNIREIVHQFFFSACHSMCETIHREMADVNPNERVQVGSYRVDGHGHQKLKEVMIFYRCL